MGENRRLTHLFHFGGSAGLAKYRGGNSWRDGTGRYFSRQNSWRDGTVVFFSRRDGAVFFFSEAGRGGRFFFPKRDGAVVFFSEAGRGGCTFFPRRDGTGWLCFFSAGTGRLYFLFAPGRAFFF